MAEINRVEDFVSLVRGELETKLAREPQLNLKLSDKLLSAEPEIVMAESAAGEAGTGQAEERTFAVEFIMGSKGTDFGSVARAHKSIATRQRSARGSVKGLIVADGPVSGGVKDMTDYLKIHPIDASRMNAAGVADAVIHAVTNDIGKALPG